MSPNKDQGDNPDIDDYMGHGEFRVIYARKGHVFSGMLRNQLESGFDRGAVELSWSFPVFEDFIIITYEFTNQTGGALSDVYFGFPYRSPTGWIDHRPAENHVWARARLQKLIDSRSPTPIAWPSPLSSSAFCPKAGVGFGPGAGLIRRNVR